MSANPLGLILGDSAYSSPSFLVKPYAELEKSISFSLTKVFDPSMIKQLRIWMMKPAYKMSQDGKELEFCKGC